MLESFDFPPPAFLRCLYDTHLEPTDVSFDKGRKQTHKRLSRRTTPAHRKNTTNFVQTRVLRPNVLEWQRLNRCRRIKERQDSSTAGHVKKHLSKRRGWESSAFSASQNNFSVALTLSCLSTLIKWRRRLVNLPFVRKLRSRSSRTAIQSHFFDVLLTFQMARH